MQTEAPAVFDMKNEPAHINELYGIGNPTTDDFGRRCLMARRLVEKGVRFVTVVSGGPAISQWDAHDDIEENHLRMAARTDQPIAALLKDLKQRGLLDSTLVVWGGEFGRTPEAQGGKGRDHNPFVFTNWLCGGGIRGGITHGESDQWGYKPADRSNITEVYDIHATLLHLLGIDHTRLTFRHNGVDRRLTDVHGEVIAPLLA
jgi:uncharacterized protein (DUF1501 family)